MSYSTQILSIEEVFGKYDTNHNGKIDKDEVKKINLFPDFKIKKRNDTQKI